MAELNERVATVEADLRNCIDDVERLHSWKHKFSGDLAAPLLRVELMEPRMRAVEEVVKRHDDLIERLRPDSWRGNMKQGVISGATAIAVLGILKALLELFGKLAELIVR